MKLKLAYLIFAAIGFMMAACAPIYEPWHINEAGSESGDASVHTVKEGESLHVIAWVYDLNYLDLAKWNDVKPPRYIIHPGQKLNLFLPDGFAIEEAPPEPASAVEPAMEDAPEQTLPPQSLAGALAEDKPLQPSSDGWVWPAKGRLLCQFSENQCRKGVYIGGTSGQPIRAALDGEVVYSGGGFKEYGSLIIIKHREDYLSAYAHNKHLFVKEGDAVVGGQEIATMGTAKAGQAVLYFQVRLKGELIDPLEPLPASY